MPKGDNQEASCGQDSEGDYHILNQLRKILDLKRDRIVTFLDDSKLVIPYPLARVIVEKYNDLRTTAEKERMMLAVWESAETFSRLRF